MRSMTQCRVRNLHNVTFRNNGSFTLPDTDTDVETDKMCTAPNENLHWSWSRFSANTSAHYHKTEFHQSRSLCRPRSRLEHTIETYMASHLEVRRNVALRIMT